MVLTLTVLFGLCVGSFLNVVIVRLPQDLSVVRPRSRCPRCERPIAWYDNIPLLSYVLLRARCRQCHRAIHWRYPLVEALTAALCVALLLHVGLRRELFVLWALAAALVASTFIDLDHRIIPDEITLPGMLLGVVASVIMPSLHGVTSPVQGFLLSVLGLLVGGGTLYLTGMIGNVIFRKECMGGGDIKLLAMVGTVVGWKLVFLAFFLAPVMALLPGLVVLFTTQSHEIPYGPFLAAAIVLAIFAGEPLLEALGIIEIIDVGVPELFRIIGESFK